MDTRGIHGYPSFDFSTICQKDAQGSVPPFGFLSSEFGLCALVLQEFLAVFDFMDRNIKFLKTCQKDARGSVSSLRVRIKRVWALRTRFARVFDGF